MIGRFHIPTDLYRRQLASLVREGLQEDIGGGDRTTDALGLGNQRATARLVAKSSGVLAGADAFEATFWALDRNASFQWTAAEGKRFRSGTTVVRIHARASALLSGERTAINFLARLSGIATATRTLVDKLPRSTSLLDTRKTAPGWRYLEKRAVILGGAHNHRIALFDALMIKSNHVAAVGDFKETVRRAVAKRGKKQLICEVRSLDQIRIALEFGVGWLLLDHFSGTRLGKAIQLIREAEKSRPASGGTSERVVVEVSGNIANRSIARVARYRPDYVSSGAITHSAPAVDFSMRWLD